MGHACHDDVSALSVLRRQNTAMQPPLLCSVWAGALGILRFAVMTSDQIRHQAEYSIDLLQYVGISYCVTVTSDSEELAVLEARQVIHDGVASCDRSLRPRSPLHPAPSPRSYGQLYVYTPW